VFTVGSLGVDASTTIGFDISDNGTAFATMLVKGKTKLYTINLTTGAATEVGKGIIDIVSFLKTLVRQKYSYHAGLEYEANADAPLPGIIESLAYMRGVLAAIE
jgi:sugar phosphate isomerase/epimerase